MLLPEPGEAGAGREPQPGPAPGPGRPESRLGPPPPRPDPPENLLCVQLRNLENLQHLDLSMNSFSRVPDCVLAMPTLQWLDMGGNQLEHLPEDVHR